MFNNYLPCLLVYTGKHLENTYSTICFYAIISTWQAITQANNRKIKMHYAAINDYATPTNSGFANTWSVVGFELKTTRDAFVKRAEDCATKSIKHAEIRYYSGKLKQISYYDANGNFYQCVPSDRRWKEYDFQATGLIINPTTANHTHVPGEF